MTNIESISDIIKSNPELPALANFKKPKTTFYGKEIIVKKELNKSELELIEVINYMRIDELENNDLIDITLIVILNNLRAMGSRMSGEDQALLVNDFIFELRSYFPTLTIKEFELIVRNGIRKKYDTEKNQTIGLSIVNFNYWAKSYLDWKSKWNLEIAKKFDKKQNLLPPVPITMKSTLDVLRGEYKVILDKYNSLPDKDKEKIYFDNYWLENGNQVSAHYLFNKLRQFKLVTDKELNIQLKKMNILKVKKETIKHATLRIEAERIIICKLAIKLRNAKLKS